MAKLIAQERDYGKTILFNEQPDSKVKLTFIRFLNWNGDRYKIIGNEIIGQSDYVFSMGMKLTSLTTLKNQEIRLYYKRKNNKICCRILKN